MQPPAKVEPTKLADQPEIAARALELYSDRLPIDLVREWSEEAEQVLEERRDVPF